MTSSHPKCSIIITVYNIEDYIESCLKDIVSQTLSDIEIIVVDDGSTDGSRTIIDAFAERYLNIKKIYFEKNTIGGVGTAANAGLNAARGEYIGFADGDDRFAPDMFERLVAAAEAADADLAMCNYFLLENDTGNLKSPADHKRWEQFGEQDVLILDNAGKSTLLSFIAVPWRKIYRRSMLEKHAIRFPVGDYFFEDNPFHWSVVLASNRCALIPAQLCQHRVSRPGQTMESADAKLFKLFLHHKTIHDMLVRTDQRASFGVDLAAWLNAQAEWIGRRCQPDQQMAFLAILQPCYDRHSLAEIRTALDTRGTGQFGTFLVLAAKSGNRRFFRDSFVEVHQRTIQSRARFILMRFGPVRMLSRGVQFGLDRVFDTTSRIFSYIFLRDLNRRVAEANVGSESVVRNISHNQHRQFGEIVNSIMILDEKLTSNRQIEALNKEIRLLQNEVLLLKDQIRKEDAGAIPISAERNTN